MPLHPTMKRRLHERLHPLIGEEEADALLDQIPDDPVTKEWLDDRFDRVDDRFDRVDARFEHVATKEWTQERFERLVTTERLDERLDRFVTKEHLDERLDRFVTKDYLDAKLEGQDHKMEGMEHRITGAMHQALQQQTHRVYGAAGVFALIISVVDRIWG
jgi:hypothetical protein